LSRIRSIEKIKSTIKNGGSPPSYFYPFLKVGTLVQKFGMFLRHRTLEHEVEAHVVSVGNLTAGGSGKTPAVIGLTREWIDKGHTVGVLTRGYGVPQSSPVVVSSEVSQENWATRLGDEPCLILSKLPGVMIFKGKDRIASAQMAIEEHHCTVLVLDDGFQYVQLKRDENILLVDATNPFGNGQLIPLGILREPVSEIRRATEIWLTRCDQVSSSELDRLKKEINEIADDVSLKTKCHRPKGVRKFSGDEPLSLDWLQSRELHAVCGLGNPKSFFQMLRELGATLLSTEALDDHEAIPFEHLEKSDPVVITEKDAVKLKFDSENVYIVEVEMEDYCTAESE